MLKGVYDIDGILGALDIDVVGYTAQGRVRAFCPMHPRRESKPNHWTMDVETGLHHCFSCGYKGNLVTLVTDLTEMDVWEALRWLRSEGLEAIVFERPRIEDAEEIEEERRISVATTEEQWAIFDPPPEAELQKRGISAEGAAHFDIRWSLAAQDEEQRELLLRERAWALPLVEWDGKFLGYQLKAKDIVKNVPTGVRKDATLFGIRQFPPGETAVLVESPLDAVILHELGYYPLAIMGSHLSATQADLLTASTNRVVVALDYDAAGKAESRRLAGELRGMHVQFFEYRRAPRREETGRRPKDVGEMTDAEITRAMRASKLPHEAGKLLGPKPEPKRQYTSRKKRRRVRR